MKLLQGICYLLAITVLSCKTNTTTQVEKNNAVIKEIFVGPTLQDCMGVAPQQCLQIKETVEASYNNFYGSIAGFNFEPNFFYKLKVAVQTLDPATLPADTSTKKYTLVNILEKTALETIHNKLYDIWVVKNLNQKKISGKQLTIELNTSNFKFSGNDGCNNFTGSFTITGKEHITFGPLAKTKKYCPDMDITTVFDKAIETTRSYNRKETRLYFYDKSGTEVMELLKVD